MGRASQIFWYINADKIPTDEELLVNYTHIQVNEELKDIRLKYRRHLKKLEKERKNNYKEEKIDRHIGCPSWPNCDLDPNGCLICMDIGNVEWYGHRD